MSFVTESMFVWGVQYFDILSQFDRLPFLSNFSTDVQNLDFAPYTLHLSDSAFFFQNRTTESLILLFNYIAVFTIVLSEYWIYKWKIFRKCDHKWFPYRCWTEWMRNSVLLWWLDCVISCLKSNLRNVSAFAIGQGKILFGDEMICANHLYQVPCIA